MSPAPDQGEPNELADGIESFLDRLLERKLFGTIGPRYRSIALVSAFVLSAWCTGRHVFGFDAMSSIASSASTSSAYAVSASPSPSPWTVPGLR